MSSVSICDQSASLPSTGSTPSCTDPLKVGFGSRGIVHREWQVTGLDGGIELVNADFVGLDSARLDFCLLDDTFNGDE